MRTRLLFLVAAGALVVAACDRDQEVETTATAPEQETVPITPDESTPDESTPDESTLDEVASEKEGVATTSSADVTPPQNTGRAGVSIVDRDGNVRLVITPSSLYMRLSERTLADIRSNFTERGLVDELKEAVIESVEQVVLEEVENAVREGVKKMTKFRIAYDLDDVTDVRYEQGRLWIDVVEEKPVSFDDIRVNGNRLALANFYEQDAERFVQTYRELR